MSKIPPQCVDLEREVLGGLMMEDHLFDEVNSIVTVEAFYKPAHQLVYKAFQDVRIKNLKIDLPTVFNQMKDNGEIGQFFSMLDLMEITNSVRSTANILSHSRVIVQNYMLRELIRISNETIRFAFEDGADAFDVLNTAEKEMANIGDISSFSEMKTADKVMVETLNAIETNKVLYDEFGKIPITGIPSGIKDLDLLTLGWQDGDLIIIAARASQGKTAFALNMARNAAGHFKSRFLNGKGKFKKVALFSLEMKASRLMMRLLSREVRIPLYELKSGALTSQQMQKIYKDGAEVLSKEGILFDDSTGLNTRLLAAKTKKLAKKGELGLIVIDYMQLMGNNEKKGTREQEVSAISRELKNIAQDYNIPVIALSQLSREAEKDKVIQLSHLRESGAIEQDADVVAAIFGYSEDDIKNNPHYKNRRFVKVLKQRDGELDTIELSAEMAIQLFEDLPASEKALSLPGNFRPDPEIRHFNEPKESGAKLFIQPGSKMNGDEDTPF